ncbi:MAG: hypothetical protein KDD35_09430, partial [Bdellovibrionales bacterium]|nr:hypothetical protein [Bdellovibrionales bacterium]
ATSFSAQMPDSTEKGMKVATLNQLFLEMPVFRGYIKIALSRKDDAVFMINLSLPPVRKGDSIEILLPLDLARSQVEQHFTEQQKKFKIRSTRGPLFYAESEPHEPVWIFNVMVTSPKLDAIEIAVGARSKSIRYESSTMVH